MDCYHDPEIRAFGGDRVGWTHCCVLLGALSLTTAEADGLKAPNGRQYLSQPLVASIYTADPSAHVFQGKIYIYPSHDVPTNIPDDDLGSEYAKRDFDRLAPRK
jgi:hypothetical protein